MWRCVVGALAPLVTAGDGVPVTGAQLPRSIVGQRRLENTHVGWERSEAPCSGPEPLSFTVFLKQQNLDVLLDAFHAVSDPSSARYGQFWTKGQVDALVAPEPSVTEAVTTWLSGHGILQDSVNARADSLVIVTSCTKASKLLAVPFHWYRQQATGQARLLFHGDASIPIELEGHIDFIGGISELWHGKSPKKQVRKSRSRSTGDLAVTPRLLRQFYGVPEDETNTSPDNYQSVVAFDDYYSASALSEFYAKVDGGMGTAPVLDEIGERCIDKTTPCDQVESDLDVQYMTALSGKGSVRTMFHNAQTKHGWVLGFSEDALELSPLPKVFSISYGWSELGQCENVAIMVCFQLGYTSRQYVDRTNANFQKLALMGSTILVSDGDDGAQGVQPDGWNPQDLDNWCPGNQVCYPRTQTKCAEVVLRNATTGETCAYPVGHMGQDCNWLFLGDFYQTPDITKALKEANPTCNLEFFIDYDYNTHMYSECECSEMNSIHHEDVVSQPHPGMNASKRIFTADFPTSSPFVTSVGATAFMSSDGQTVSHEYGATIKDTSIITTGGGFSDVFPMPAWQASAVGAYHSGTTPKPPAGTYDASKRAYPDVTLNGHNYQVTMPIGEYDTDCPCEEHSVDGTSASSPALAGMLSLINGHLLAAGKSQLGFLNPLLYAAHASDPTIFNDVVYGDSKCTRDYCMQYGFEAGEGWDPVTGLGSLDYTKFKQYALAAQGIETITLV